MFHLNNFNPLCYFETFTFVMLFIVLEKNSISSHYHLGESLSQKFLCFFFQLQITIYTHPKAVYFHPFLISTSSLEKKHTSFFDIHSPTLLTPTFSDSLSLVSLAQPFKLLQPVIAVIVTLKIDQVLQALVEGFPFVTLLQNLSCARGDQAPLLALQKIFNMPILKL